MRTTPVAILTLALAFAFASTATANVHFWAISQVYSNSDGSVQYVELYTASAGQEFFVSFGNNTRIESRMPTLPFTLVDTWNFTSDSPAPTNNRHVLVGTPNVADVFGVVPDYTTLDPSFLLLGGGRAALQSPNWGTFGTFNYPALPGGNTASFSGVDGRSSGLQTAAPRNFAGYVPGNNGDFDDDTDVDADDIDILWAIVRGGGDDPFASTTTHDAADLDGSGFLNEDDVDFMLANLLTAGPGRAYGDADLDGGVGGLDFTAWRLRAGTGWANGDFDGDGGIGGLDFTLWRTRPTAYPDSVGPHVGSAGPTIVPEPTAFVLLALGLPTLSFLVRRRK